MNSVKSSLIFLLVFSLAVSCSYKPYIKYNLAGDKLPKFSNRDIESGSKTNDRLAYDITFYDWTIYPNYEKKSVKGIMRIDFESGLEEKVIKLDLQHRLKVDSVLSTSELEDYKHKGEHLILTFKDKLEIGQDYAIEIYYRGKPANIMNQGPVVWGEDRAGKPFYSTLTQGIGPYYLFPCKDMLYDEPDSCIIRVGIPEGLKVVANGKLVSQETQGDLNIFTWKVDNPINVYNLSFNVGDYTKISYPYTDLNGQKNDIVVWALREDSATAAEFYQQTVPVMKEYEKMFGPFPWKNDGCVFVETAINGGAMEHQSAISMGRILRNNWRSDSLSFKLNSTLVHELAHEWWGNSVTAEDYCDAWLHEGFASYCEGLILEKLNGKKAYRLNANYEMQGIDNKRPVHKTCGVRYNSWANSKDLDIYNKGSIFLLTLREQLDNDELFFSALRTIYDENQKGHLTTERFQELFEKETGRDFSAYFETYLNQTEPPVFQYHFDKEANTLYYRWKNKLPEGFEMKVLLGTKDFLEITPTYEYQSIQLRDESDQVIQRERFGYMLLEKDKKFKS